MKTKFPKELFSAKILLEILITHIDGTKVERPRDPIRRTATIRLVAFDMLTIPHPKYWGYSVITDQGRRKLGELLGAYADMLQRYEQTRTERLATAAPEVEHRQIVAYGPLSYEVPAAKPEPVAAA